MLESNRMGHALRTGASHRLRRARTTLNGLLRSRLVSALAAPRRLDGYLQVLDPTWSLHAVRARVVEIIHETSGAASLWLMPNENWRGFLAGQFVTLSAPVQGVRTTRCFSLSSAPEDGLPLRLTIKALPGGRLSSWATQQAQVGDVVEISQALGEFVLPDPIPPMLVLMSGGSGITPLMSILRHLSALEYQGSVHFLHYARREVIFLAELNSLAQLHPNFRLQLEYTRKKDSRPDRLSRAALDRFAPDWREALPFVCGPAEMIDAAASLWSAPDCTYRLRVERFSESLPAASSAAIQTTHRLRFVRSGREAAAQPGLSLLEQAEAAGLTPDYGCRVGVCRTCTARKLSGSVRNQLTGKLCTATDAAIQLCIHRAESDVELDL